MLAAAVTADLVRVLKPTAHHAYRLYCTEPAAEGRTALFYTQAKTVAHKTESDHYLVEEELDAPAGVRSFLVAKQHVRPGQDADVYRVTVRAGRGVCTCRGFATHKHCRHADALTDMADVQARMLEDTVADVWPSPEQVAADAGHDRGHYATAHAGADLQGGF